MASGGQEKADHQRRHGDHERCDQRGHGEVVVAERARALSGKSSGSPRGAILAETRFKAAMQRPSSTRR